MTDFAGFKTEFCGFLAETETAGLARSRHFFVGPLKVYMRVGRRFVEERWVVCVQIGAVDVTTPGQGLFDAMLSAIRQCTDLPILMENVLTARFVASLERRGFRIITGDREGPPDLFRDGIIDFRRQ